MTCTDEQAVPVVVQQLHVAWNEHDVGAFDELFDEDADFVNVYGMRERKRRCR